MNTRNSEKPADEMRRLIRTIAGPRGAGETDEQLRQRAARRLGITHSRAKVFWFGETDNIRADEMDMARELVFVQPIEGALNAISEAERWIDEAIDAGCVGLAERLLVGLHQRLAERSRLSVSRAADPGSAASGRAVRRASGLPVGRGAASPAPGRLTRLRTAT